MTLQEKIAWLAEHPTVEANVSWTSSASNDCQIKNINRALRNATSDERLQLAIDLLNLWADYRRQEEAESLFGPRSHQYCNHRLMFTINDEGTQFRAWYALPATLNPEHIESHGRGLLFGVYGPREEVERYRSMLLTAESILGPYSHGYLEFRNQSSGIRVYLYGLKVLR